jgi:hypothetical protein
LPETRGRTICDTMDEEEYNSTNNDLPVLGWLTSRTKIDFRVGWLV